MVYYYNLAILDRKLTLKKCFLIILGDVSFAQYVKDEQTTTPQDIRHERINSVPLLGREVKQAHACNNNDIEFLLIKFISLNLQNILSYESPVKASRRFS